MSLFPFVPVIQTPDVFRRFGQAINHLLVGKQEASDNLTSIADLDLSGHSGDAVVVTAGEDGFELSAVSGGGALTDADYGDITVSSSGTVMTIDAGTVTLAKMANMATASLIYRKTAGAGAPEVNSLVALKTDLGLTGTNSGDQTITLSGDVGGAGTSAITTTIGAGAVTLAMQANMATASVVYRKTAGSGAPEVQALATLKTDLGLTGTNSGDQTITLTGDVTGSGTGSFAATLANSGVSAASYTNASVTFDAKGRATAASSGVAPALVLLEQHTASSSASLDFSTAITATYDEYQIELLNIIPATDATILRMRMSTNAGSSYDSAGNYSWQLARTNRFGQTNTGADSAATQIECSNSTDNASTAGISGTLRLFSPASTSLHKAVQGTAMQLNSDGTSVENLQVAGFYRSTTAVNAFQFLMSSGNIASGIIRVYGIAK